MSWISMIALFPSLFRSPCPTSIAVSQEATLPERTAASELADYLQRVTGTPFEMLVETENCPCPTIYVGHTDFAVSHGVQSVDMEQEEWLIRAAGRDLILTGGRPRGTLYAVYRLLEDVVGVHWWNPYSETVPHKPNLSVAGIHLRGKPAFRYRDIYMLYAGDGGRFAARNRLNRQGDRAIEGKFGGSVAYGPPYHVHTFYLYFPPEQYFKEHPTWYSWIGGERRAERHQLCLTNPELRKAFVDKLRAYIASSARDAKEAGQPPPTVFSISQNDWHGACQCQSCQEIARREGSEAGPLLDFLNHVSDAIREDHPDVYLSTLAYQYTQSPPETIHPRDNIIVRLCDTTSNFSRSIKDPHNAPFRKHLLRWSRVAKNVRIWDYAVNYGTVQNKGLPMPTVHTYATDYRFYAANNVEGVFTEHEYPVLADMRDLKVWMMMKLLEDPFQDYDVLLATFTDGFYGPAGRHIRLYLKAIEEASEEKRCYFSMSAAAQMHSFLDVQLTAKLQRLFDRAEDKVRDDASLLPRVRHARLSLDRATVVRFPALMGEWIEGGGTPERLPLDRDTVSARCRETWMTEIDRRIPPSRQAEEREICQSFISASTLLKTYVPVPKRFSDLPRETVFHYTADRTRNWKEFVKVVPEKDSESGITDRLDIPFEETERYKLPMPWGVYDTVTKKTSTGHPIEKEDIAGPGYHWYKMGCFTLTSSHYAYLFSSWIIQLDLAEVVDPNLPHTTHEIWARIAFQGPAFPHGKAQDKNAICVERIVVIRGCDIH